jgi:hypothetical protein
VVATATAVRAANLITSGTETTPRSATLKNAPVRELTSDMREAFLRKRKIGTTRGSG